MKTKNKIMVIIASLILVFGLLYAPTTNISEARADSEICSLSYPGMPNPCTQAAVNCFCEIVVTPDE